MRHPFRKFLSRRQKQPDLNRLREAARRLDIVNLTTEEQEREAGPLSFTLKDIMPETASSRLFGFYTADGVAYALEELGIFGLIKERGYHNLEVTISGDAWVQTLKIFGRAKNKTHLLIENRYRKTIWQPPDGEPLGSEYAGREFKAIIIEWLLFQHPLGQFTPERPQLPGQVHPGLGVRDEYLEVLYAAAERLDIDAYLISAKLFHNALIYSPAFFFISPHRQAEIMAILEAGKGRSMQDLTLAIEGGFLKRPDGYPYFWTGEMMIRPLTTDLHQAFDRSGYLKMVEEMAGDMVFEFDWAGFEAARPELMKSLMVDREAFESREQTDNLSY